MVRSTARVQFGGSRLSQPCSGPESSPTVRKECRPPFHDQQSRSLAIVGVIWTRFARKCFSPKKTGATGPARQSVCPFCVRVPCFRTRVAQKNEQTYEYWWFNSSRQRRNHVNEIGSKAWGGLSLDVDDLR